MYRRAIRVVLIFMIDSNIFKVIKLTFLKSHPTIFEVTFFRIAVHASISIFQSGFISIRELAWGSYGAARCKSADKFEIIIKFLYVLHVPSRLFLSASHPQHVVFFAILFNRSTVIAIAMLEIIHSFETLPSSGQHAFGYGYQAVENSANYFFFLCAWRPYRMEAFARSSQGSSTIIIIIYHACLFTAFWISQWS